MEALEAQQNKKVYSACTLWQGAGNGCLDSSRLYLAIINKRSVYWIKRKMLGNKYIDEDIEE